MSAALAPSPLTPKPDHVPDSLIYDFDLQRDAALLANPHDRVLDPANPPVFHGGQVIGVETLHLIWDK